MRVPYWISKTKRAHALSRATRLATRIYAHARKHTHREIFNTFCFSMKTMLRYTYIACPVTKGQRGLLTLVFRLLGLNSFLLRVFTYVRR
jgi:hypothetical protein